MSIWTLNATISLPVTACPSVIEKGERKGWGDPLMLLSSVEFPVELSADLNVDGEYTEEEIISAIENAGWESNYTEDLLADALEKKCPYGVPANLPEIDEAGNGCDGIVRLQVSDPEVLDVVRRNWGQHSPEVDMAFVDVDVDSVIREWASNYEGFENTMFYSNEEKKVYREDPRRI